MAMFTNYQANVASVKTYASRQLITDMNKQGVLVPSSILLVKNFLGQEDTMAKRPITGSNHNERPKKRRMTRNLSQHEC